MGLNLHISLNGKILINVVSPEYGEQYMAVNPTTPMKKVMEGYLYSKGLRFDSVKFQLQRTDEYINPGLTPAELQLQNEDVLNVVSAQESDSEPRLVAFDFITDLIQQNNISNYGVREDLQHLTSKPNYIFEFFDFQGNNYIVEVQYDNGQIYHPI